MQSIPGNLQHGDHVQVHQFIDRRVVARHVDVGEHEIRQWHDLASSSNCTVCHRHNGQLIAVLPYYSPMLQGLHNFAAEGEGFHDAQTISYNRVQELSSGSNFLGFTNFHATVSHSA